MTDSRDLHTLASQIADMVFSKPIGDKDNLTDAVRCILMASRDGEQVIKPKEREPQQGEVWGYHGSDTMDFLVCDIDDTLYAVFDDGSAQELTRGYVDEEQFKYKRAKFSPRKFGEVDSE